MSIIWKHKNLLGLTVEKEKAFPHPTVEGLLLRCYLSGRKSWVWKRMLDGKRYNQKLGRFPAMGIVDAQALASDYNERVERGEDLKAAEREPVQPERERMTVEQGWALYIEDCRRRGCRSLYKRDLEGQKDLVGLLGPKFLSDVTSDDIRRCVARPMERQRSRKGGAVTGGAVTSNRLLAVCRTLFKFCLESGYDDLTRNPAQPVRPVRVTGRKKKRVLSLRELALLMLAARELDRERGDTTWADIIAVLVLIGNRKSEALFATGGEWDSIARVWRIGADRYKTWIDAMLPVGPSVAAIFDRRAKPGKFVFPAQTGVRTSQDRHICDRLTELMESIGGEPVERWSMHHIRVGFRSQIRKAKIADSELAERIIHPGRQLEMSEHYDPDMVDEMREALTAWDALIQAEIAKIAVCGLAAVA